MRLRLTKEEVKTAIALWVNTKHRQCTLVVAEDVELVNTSTGMFNYGEVNVDENKKAPPNGSPTQASDKPVQAGPNQNLGATEQVRSRSGKEVQEA